MSNVPRFRIKQGEVVGVELFFQLPDIYQNEKTFLDDDSASDVGNISANGTNFSTGQYVIIGQPGSERAEIIKIHASTTPTTTTITFTSNTKFAHNRGDVVYFIPYNQIAPERSTDSGDNYSVLSATDIRADSLETYLQRPTDAATDYYKFRFFNEADTQYSGYSDGIIASGLADNSLGKIKQRALRSSGEKLGKVITNDFLDESLDEARRKVDDDERVIRWSFRTGFNTDIGNVIPGAWSLSAPTNLKDRNTQKNILGLRIGRDRRKLNYIDWNEMQDRYRNVAHTTLNGAVITSDTEIDLTASGDFLESGSINIAAEAVSGTIDTVTYAGNTEVSNQLTGVTGIVATGHSTLIDVWQNITFGEPSAYTIHNGTLYFDVPFSDQFAGENIYMDYYTTMTDIDSDADTLDEPEYDFYVPYLRYKIRYLKTNGKVKIDEDSDMKEFREGVDRMIAKETSGQFAFIIPE